MTIFHDIKANVFHVISKDSDNKKKKDLWENSKLNYVLCKVDLKVYLRSKDGFCPEHY